MHLTELGSRDAWVLARLGCRKLTSSDDQGEPVPESDVIRLLVTRKSRP
jgi:hypothetical protein